MFYNKKYNEAINIFQDVFDFTENNEYKIKSSYKIACCYSYLNNTDKLYEYLNLSIEHGYKDWQNLIEDYDFRKIHKNTKFINIIRKLYEKYKNVYTGPYDKYIEYIIDPSNMNFLKEHNII